MKRLRKFTLLAIGFLTIFILSSCDTDISSEKSYASPAAAAKDSEGKKEAVSDADNPSDALGENSEEDFYEDEDEEFEYEEDEEDSLCDDESSVTEEIVRREWTILVYMAADNNLESEAIADFNELENADFDERVTVLVLFDRAEDYDATNGNWTDTRLYEIRKDGQQNRTLISSEQLDCEELGLQVGGTTELDMANPLTLSGFLEFARRSYEAEQYALIMWGHGTGWRNSVGEGQTICSGSCDSSEELFRAFAIDSASNSYMTISQLRSAIVSGMDGKNLSIIGFDTCFGMCLETAYELSGIADFMLGTPALVPESGWNYTGILTDFSESNLTTDDLIRCISEQFAESYKHYAYATFTCVNLSRIPEFVRTFSAYSQGLADSIQDKSRRDEIMSVFEIGTVSYRASSYPTDFYVDVYDLLEKLSPFRDSLSVRSLLADTLVSSWSASGSKSSLGVFFCVYRASGIAAASHPSNYLHGSRDTNLSRFVTDCIGYVPDEKNSGSLLDKLFYTKF